MRLSWALLAFLESVGAVDTYAAVAGKACSGEIGCAGYYRAFGVTTSPADSDFGPPSNVTGLSVAAIGAQVALNGTLVAAKLDVGGFRFKTPNDVSDNNNRGLTFYFGYLGVTGAWDSTTKTGAMAGALAEVVSSFSSVNVYYNNDGKDGFHWDLAARQDILNCTNGEAKMYDTLDVKGTIDLKDLDWTPIEHTKLQCNTLPGLSTAPPACEIHSLTTSGSNSTLSSSPIVTFTIRIASMPLLINRVMHGPDYAKFDVGINYPWAAKNLYNNATARLTLIALHAGKTAAFVGAAKVDADGTHSLVFAAPGGQVSKYSYTGNATVDGQVSPVFTQIVTGQEIIDFNCAGAPCLLTATQLVVTAVLQPAVNWLQAFGWRSSITFHSLGAARPANVFWDPAVGAGPSAPSGTTPSSASIMGPSLFLGAIAALLF